MFIVKYPSNTAGWKGDFLLAEDGSFTHIKDPATEAALIAAGAETVSVNVNQFNELYWHQAQGGAGAEPTPVALPVTPKPSPGVSTANWIPGGSPLGELTQAQVGYSGLGAYRSGEAFCTQVVIDVCKLLNIPQTHWVPGMVTIAGRESAFNSPDWQVNDTDLNAIGPVQSDGHPLQSSRGGWQCVPWFADGSVGTFARYHRVGTSVQVYDPWANCAAAIAYIVLDYGIAWDGHDLLTKWLGVGNGSANGFGIQQADPSRQARGY